MNEPSAPQETDRPPPVRGEGPPAQAPVGVWERLKRHKVAQWTLAYAAAAYTMLHATEMVSEAMEWPRLVAKILTLLLVLGVPVVVTLAWYHGAKGLKRFSAPELTIITILLILTGSVLWVLNNGRRERPNTEQPHTAVESASQSKSIPAVARTGPSLAVLPFIDMSPEHNQEYFSDGLAEELLNQLAHVKKLRVIGRTSSFAFKGRSDDLRHIGEVLGVNRILEGSVRKSGKNLRITAQLIDASDGSHLWSETYDRTLNDVFSIQDEIAHTVVAALQIQLGTDNLNPGRTQDVAAFDEFLAGRALLNSNEPNSMVAAIPHLEHAVELDAAYVPARLWLIDAYTRSSFGASRQNEPLRRKQNAVIDEVVKLVPGTPEASLALSYRAGHERNLETLEHLLKDSLQVAGETGVRARLRYGQFLIGVAHPDLAVTVLEQVRSDDPLDIFARTSLVLAYEVAGKLDRADAEMKELLQLPGGVSVALLGSAVTRAQDQHDLAKLRAALEALAAAEKGVASAALNQETWLDDPVRARREIRQEAADSRLEGGIYSLGDITQWAAFFGDKELALKAVNKMNDLGYSFEASAFILWRPVLSDLRGDPGFKAELRRWGLINYWRTAGDWGNFCKPLGKDDFECH